MNTGNEFDSMEIEAIEDLYKKYKEAPESVDESFRYFFQGFDLATNRFPLIPNEKKWWYRAFPQRVECNASYYRLPKKRTSVYQNQSC